MASETREILLAFDLFGTLLNTSSIAKAVEEKLPNDKVVEAANIASEWRRFQLEYTWRLTCMGKYLSFFEITQLSLAHALLQHGVSILPQADIDYIITTYSNLTLFPDATSLIEVLPDFPDMFDARYTIFSNGTPEMIKSAIDSSSLLKDAFVANNPLEWAGELRFISVHDTGKFKPAREVYDYFYLEKGRGRRKGDIFLVSANPFDVVGAKNAGWGAIWVDREGKGWVDQLGKPDFVVRGLEEVTGVVKGLVGEEE